MNVGDKFTLRIGKDGKKYATQSDVPVAGDKILLTPGNDGRLTAHKSGSPEVGSPFVLTQGSDGRSYALVGGLSTSCLIDLHRFALVSGSTTDSPTTAVTVTYADTTPYKQCGYKYSGYITLFLSISGSSVYAAVELRICKNDPKRIVIETYGEVAKTVTGGMSLWFNKGTDKHFPTRDDFPETGSSNVNYINDATGKYYIWNETLYEEGSCWVKLNSTTSGVIMPYATISYTFKESKRNGSTTIDCCKKCPSCGCKTCDISSRFFVTWGWGSLYNNASFPDYPYEGLGITKYGNSGLDQSNRGAVIYNYGIYDNDFQYSITWYDTYNSTPLFTVQYKMECDKVYIKVTAESYVLARFQSSYGYMWNVVAGIIYIDDTGYRNLLASQSPYKYGTYSGDIETSFPFDYLKNCFGSVRLPVTVWCADKIYVNNPSSIEFLKKVADCGGTGIAYLKAIDTYPTPDELRIRAVGPVLAYDINGWIQFDPDTWMMASPWPNLYPITDNEILLEEVTWDEYQNTAGQIGARVAVSTGTFANLHGLNLKFTCEVWGTVTIDPTKEDEYHQRMQIIESEVGYVGGYWFISADLPITGTLSDDGTTYTMQPQQFTFYCRGGLYGNTQNALLYQQIGLSVQVSPAYVSGYKSTHISGGFRLISIDDICGGTNFYPSKGTQFKSNPIYSSGGGFLSYVIEFNDYWV